MEAQTEVSLERVRAQAMSMKKPDELLHICKILFEELLRLGFGKLRNTMVNINYDDKRYFLNYDFSEMAGPTINNSLMTATRSFKPICKNRKNG